jgi:signal transduction histidine kinase
VSIRLRLALVYSLVLCFLAAMAIGAVYVALDHAVNSEAPPVPVQVRPAPNAPVVGVAQLESAQRAANEAALEKLRTYSLSALLVLFAVSFGVGWLLAGYVLIPIGRITSVARDISATDLSRRIGLEGPDDELHQLADTFDDMLERLDDAFAKQRAFIEEASHELRNPLAVIRTNLEVTLADPDASAEDLRHTAEVVERSTERMSRLVDDLLLYTRNETPVLERTPVDLGRLVQEAADEFRAPAEARGLSLESASMPGVTTYGDRDALRQALSNLLANATRLAPEGTQVRVRAGREGPWNWMAVDDQGPGIAPADQERVFQRFWRGTTKEGAGERRSGLGLTIVRQIAEAHGGEVKLVSAPGVGSTFAVWLPAADAVGATTPSAPPEPSATPLPPRANADERSASAAS